MAAKPSPPDLARQVLRDPVHWLAFGLGSGLLPVAPGTWGSLLAVGVYWALPPVSPIVMLPALAVAFALGCVICGTSALRLGVHDHGGIVFDEIVAMLLVLWLFKRWLPAYSVEGRRLEDAIVGLRQYLSIAEADDLKRLKAPLRVLDKPRDKKKSPPLKPV